MGAFFHCLAVLVHSRPRASYGGSGFNVATSLTRIFRFVTFQELPVGPNIGILMETTDVKSKDVNSLGRQSDGFTTCNGGQPRISENIKRGWQWQSPQRNIGIDSR
jgi:hypothetical protein